jgi:glycosyltransferase involved in cell wall biosynthesis
VIDPTEGRLGGVTRPTAPGLRVILDARPLQAPDRAPLAATYLAGLLGAFDDAPLPGESFAFLIGSDLDDPTAAYRHLSVVGRRQLPPTRLLRSGSMTVDPFLLRGAELGAAWRADRSGAAGAVYHAVGGGSLPIASDLPVVVTLLDLAPWELPEAFARSVAGRFGQRLRSQLLRDAARVIVGSEATARAARRVLRIRRERLRVVALAPRPAFAVARSDAQAVVAAGLRARFGLAERYLVITGRFDARVDLATFLSALGSLAAANRPDGLAADAPWPPRVLVVGASPDDRASVARAAARKSVGESLAYAPALPVEDLAALVRGARAVILPALSEAAGLPVIEALACGTPVVASAVGPLPGLVGRAGLSVEPRDPDRLAVAIATIWADDTVYAGVASSARERAALPLRTWADVAADTRAIYAEAGIRRPT